jgi:hypothetical protein
VIEHLLPLIRNGPPIQWRSCFIIYSVEDDAFVQRLYADLQSKGVMADTRNRLFERASRTSSSIGQGMAQRSIDHWSAAGLLAQSGYQVSVQSGANQPLNGGHNRELQIPEHSGQRGGAGSTA